VAIVQALLDRLLDSQFMLAALAAVAAAGTVLTLALPLAERNALDKRMRAVALERDKIRARERVMTRQRITLRQQPKAYMKQVVDRFNLDRWLGTDTARARLTMAGYRGQQAEIAFLFFRMVLPIGLCLITAFYVFVLLKLQQPLAIKLGIVIFAAYAGIKLPELFVSNAIQKRQASIRRAWPDALDLLLICVESGMSIEQAFRKVAQEIGSQSVPLAEELTLATAELSYLPDRRAAFENLGNRTGLDVVRNVATALIQAERYGTSLGQALRVLAQESRDQRMTEAEKKAAALPPKLTVPMILFFLPVLFVVIIIPALIQVFDWK